MVNNACVMHNVSAADINTMMQISKPWCVKMCTEWRIAANPLIQNRRARRSADESAVPRSTKGASVAVD